MNNKNMDDIKRETASLLENHSEQSLLSDGPKKNGFWGILCMKLNSKYDKNEANRLKVCFRRNVEGYRDFIQEKISKKDKSTLCKIKYSKAEWQDIVKEHITSDGKFMKQKFAEIFSYKLQDEMGLFCCLRFRYNYFPSLKGKNSKSLWYAELECLGNDVDCNSKLTVNAYDMITYVELNIRVFKELIEKHKEKIMKKISVTGPERETQAIKLVANGITNTKAENILFNSKSSDARGSFIKNFKLH